VRVSVAPQVSDNVARSVLNPAKEGRTAVLDGGSVVVEEVHGRYVIQLATGLEPVHVRRAVGHEVATKDPAGQHVHGDLVWSPSRQEDYMKLAGLAVNDRSQMQYQLWIFDKNRDDKFPVDGGVFDVVPTGHSGETIVRITPRLPIQQAALFAVTIERPGGVVVSSRDRIVVTAAPKG